MAGKPLTPILLRDCVGAGRLRPFPASATAEGRQLNASLHLLPEAAATQERRLEAVRCKALLGGARECL